MVDTIRRIVALVTYANASITGKDNGLDIKRLLSHHCYRMEFVENSPRDIPGYSKKISPDPAKWISSLVESNAHKVILHFAEMNQYGLPDHITAAFVGGGSQWFIEVKYEGGSHLFLYQENGSGGLKDQLILLDREFMNQIPTPTVEDSRRQLSRVLASLIDLAKAHEQANHWASIFGSALDTLNTSNPYTSDFLPYGIYSLESHQLLETAFRSWVFGGMGSWNDMAFENRDQDKYLALTDELYTAICNALVAGVNSIS